MRVYRLILANHADSAFSGEGARLFGGRWNPKGYPVAYTSLHPSLALVELLVHLRPQRIPVQLVLCSALLPQNFSVRRLTVTDLPKNWAEVPAPPELQIIGRDWLESRDSLALVVPSAVVPDESNVLINPVHPDARGIRLLEPRPFRFDERLSWGDTDTGPG